MNINPNSTTFFQSAITASLCSFIMTWNHLQLILRLYCGFYLGPIPEVGGWVRFKNEPDRQNRERRTKRQKRDRQANRENCKDSIPRVAFIHVRLLVYTE